MAIEFFSSIDVNQNDIHFPVIHKLGSEPSSPSAVAGQMYYNSSANTLHYHNGTAWQTVGTSSAAGDIESVVAGTGMTGGATSGDATLNVIGGDGITANANDMAITATQTTLTSITNTSLVVGRDAHNQIDFGTDNQIKFKTNNETPVIIMKASGEVEATKFDGALEGNADTATVATTVTVADESSDDSCNVLFTTAATGNLAPKSGTNLTFNSSSGELTATGFVGALTGNASGSAGTVTSIGNLTGDVTSSNRATTIAASAVHHGMLNDDIISGQGAMTTVDQADLLMVDDGPGTVKKITFSNFEDEIFGNVSGDGSIAAGGALTVTQSAGDFTVTGDLTVSGDTITANVGTLDVEDKNITLNKSAGDSSSTADGAGITIQDAVDASNDASILWTASSDTFTFSHAINANVTGNVTGNASGSAGTVTSIGNLTGDVTSSNRATTIAADAVTYAKIQNVTATNVVLGRDSAGAGIVEEISASSLRTMLNIESGATGDQTKSDIDGLAITTVGTLDTGNATAIVDAASDTAAGKVELASATEAKNGSGAGKVVDASQLGARSVTATIVVGSMSTNKRVMIEHGLNTQNVIVQMWDVSTHMTVYADVYRADDDISTADVNAVTIDFGVVTPPNNIEVLITSLKGATDIGAGGSIVYT